MSQLEALMKSAYNTAKKIVNENSSDMLTPIFLELRPGNKVDIIAAPMGNDREKDALAAALRHKFKQDRAEAYVHVSEAWMLDYPADTLRSEMMQPSKSERRKEIVIVVGQDIDGHAIMRMADIIRDADNKRSLSEIKKTDMDPKSISGRFATLLSED